MDETSKMIKDTFERWYDPDIPEEAFTEIQTLVAGYMTMKLLGMIKPIDELICLFEMCLAIFNLGRAHPHEPLG